MEPVTRKVQVSKAVFLLVKNLAMFDTKINLGSIGVSLVIFVVLYFLFKGIFPTPSASVAQQNTTTEPVVSFVGTVDNRASCLQKVETDYAQNWKTACGEAYTDLQKYLDNCSLPQSYEDQVDNQRLQEMSDCYSTYSQ